MSRQSFFPALLLLLLSVAFTGIFAQEEFCNDVSKEAKKYYLKAAETNFIGEEAYFNLKKAITAEEEFTEALYELGLINEKKYRQLSQSRLDSDKSLKNYENRMVDYYSRTIQSCPGFQNNRLSYLLGEHYFFKKEYSTARAYLNDYAVSRKDDKSNQLRDRALKWITDIDTYFAIINNPVPYNPLKVGGASTESDEYLPTLSPDNRFLYFTRKELPEQKSSVNCGEKEVFMRGNNNYNNSFSECVAVEKPFNQGTFQGGSSVSVDNKLIFVTVVENINVGGYAFANGDIFYTEFRDGAWSELKSCGPNINSQKIWEGQPSISADNKTLYFSRAIDKIIPGEHYGLMDIYMSERQSDGSWGRAVNLGPSINTDGNEKSPFMHSDSYTLYFSSDRHIGVGGFDIFYSKMENDGSFQSIKNLGYPINTTEDEHGFIVSTDGKSGFFSSLMDGESLDIYSFDLYEEARPENVIFVKGETISGKESIEGLEIKLKNVVTEKEVNAVLDESTGEYVGVIAVKENEDVLMTAKKDGYAFTSQYISSNENVVGRPVETKMEVKEIKKGESYRINDINFATNSYDLNAQVKAILDEFGAFMKRNENLSVELHGHTDNVGNNTENQVLSENRARAVYQYLVDSGIEAERLAYKGFGPYKPVASNNTTEGRAINRRTEFLVISD